MCSSHCEHAITEYFVQEQFRSEFTIEVRFSTELRYEELTTEIPSLHLSSFSSKNGAQFKTLTPNPQIFDLLYLQLSLDNWTYTMDLRPN